MNVSPPPEPNGSKKAIILYLARRIKDFPLGRALKQFAVECEAVMMRVSTFGYKVVVNSQQEAPSGYVALQWSSGV